VSVVKCTLDDCELLAEYNRQLREDEKYDSHMTVPELTERMKEFLRTEYDAYFFKIDGETAGYALVRNSAVPKYLRHFFICRAHRRKGCGRLFFMELMELLGESTIDIEVLDWNETGLRFWESLGFRVRSYNMRYKK
jgi:predicted acetyltransferase